MANLSDASGGATIYAKTPEQIKKVFEVLKETMEGGDYGAWFTNEVPDISPSDENLYEGSVGFSGTGRWTFQNTLSELPEKFGYKFKNQPQEIEEFTWWIDFNYIDLETGCEVFYQSVDEIYHTAGDSIEKCTFTQMDMENIHLSLFNMCANGWDLIDALEILLPYMYEDEFQERDAELLEELLDDVRRNHLHYSTVQECLKWLYKGLKKDDEILKALYAYWQQEGFYHSFFGHGASDIDDVLNSNLDKDKLDQSIHNSSCDLVSETLGGIYEDYSEDYLHLPYRDLNDLLEEAGYPTLKYSEFESINQRKYWKGGK